MLKETIEICAYLMPSKESAKGFWLQDFDWQMSNDHKRTYSLSTQFHPFLINPCIRKKNAFGNFSWVI